MAYSWPCREFSSLRGAKRRSNPQRPLFSMLWIASRSLSSGQHSRDPLARNTAMTARPAVRWPRCRTGSATKKPYGLGKFSSTPTPSGSWRKICVSPVRGTTLSRNFTFLDAISGTGLDKGRNRAMVGRSGYWQDSRQPARRVQLSLYLGLGRANAIQPISLAIAGIIARNWQQGPVDGRKTEVSTDRDQ